MHVVGDSEALRRTRLTVPPPPAAPRPASRLVGLWGLVAAVAGIVQWFFLLANGWPYEPLDRFLARYVRYGFHVHAYGSLTANPFPGFTGRPGAYPLDLVLPAPRPQPRWKTLLRFVLALPAVAVDIALLLALVVDAVLIWFAALATGAAPEGLRNLSVYAAFALQARKVNAYSLPAHPDALPAFEPRSKGERATRTPTSPPGSRSRRPDPRRAPTAPRAQGRRQATSASATHIPYSSA